MIARKVLVPLLHALPWFVAAVVMLLSEEPLSRGEVAGVLVLVGVIMAVRTDSARVHGETRYLVGLRHAAEEAQREGDVLEQAGLPDRAAVAYGVAVNILKRKAEP